MKKALCILLSLIMLLSASTTAFASEMIDKSFCIDDYNQYTIKLFDETLHTRSTCILRRSAATGAVISGHLAAQRPPVIRWSF